MENGEGDGGEIGMQMIDKSRNRRRRQQEEAAGMNGRKEDQETIELRPTHRELISSPLLRDEEKEKAQKMEDNEEGPGKGRH
jgi:hypothetical protein